MSTVTKPVALDETLQKVVSGIDRVASAINKQSGGTIYGFIINGNESDPSAAVSYTDDAIGMTPAAMDYSNDVFDYGSWADAFFMPRPCMLQSDGTVDYYLKESDYTKKADGTASDVANTSYDGNAMMEWGRNGRKIWMKITPIGTGKSAKIQIADYQADDEFHDWPFHNCLGQSADHFYTPIYNGSVISTKMRSLSGQTVSNLLTAAEEITAAKGNNPGTEELWNIECFADRMLINMLLVLMGKSLNTQAVFGTGLTDDGTQTINDGFTTGVHNAKGLFYGTNSGAADTYTNAVKVFGMENYWGFQNRRHNGLILSSGVTKVKLCYGQEDGSSVTGYNTTGSNYKIANSTAPSGTSGNYTNEMKFTEDGAFPQSNGGSASTYYCDAMYYDNTSNRFARLGGSSAIGLKAGAFYCSLHGAASSSGWIGGAALSCKPLV